MSELETEESKNRSEIADYLRDLADQLDSENEVELKLGGQSVILDPVDPVTFKLEGESDWTEGDDQAKQSIEFELVWWKDVHSTQDASLQTSTN